MKSFLICVTLERTPSSSTVYTNSTQRFRTFARMMSNNPGLLLMDRALWNLTH